MQRQKKNILFLSSWYPTRQKPFDGNFVQKHAEAANLYNDVKVLHVTFDNSLKKKSECIEDNINNIHTCIIYLKTPQTKPAILNQLVKFIKYIKSYFYGYKKLYGKTNKPDIIHANVLIPISFIAFLFSLTKKIPYVISEHWTGYLPEDPNKPGKSIVFFRYFAKKAKFILPVTEHLAAAMQKYGIKAKYSIVPNVVDTDLFTINNLTIKRNTKRIIHVSSLLDEQKNFSTILLALSQITRYRKDFILEVVSDGDFSPYQHLLESPELTGIVHIHKKKTTQEVAEIMRDCDFLILFSNYENFPCVIAEAMSCGLPILSTRVGGIHEHIHEKFGILIKPCDIGMLTEKIIFMLDNFSNFDKAEIRNYAVRHFSYEVVGKMFSEIYNQVSCSQKS